MKRIGFLVLMGFIISCKTSLEVQEFQYSRTTQTGRLSIAVNKDSVIQVFRGRGGEERKAFPTDENVWIGLQTSAAKVAIKNVGQLTAPTNKRQTDAAPFSKLFFVTKDSTYVSCDFDGNVAPDELMPIMNYFVQLMDRP